MHFFSSSAFYSSENWSNIHHRKILLFPFATTAYMHVTHGFHSSLVNLMHQKKPTKSPLLFERPPVNLHKLYHYKSNSRRINATQGSCTSHPNTAKWNTWSFVCIFHWSFSSLQTNPNPPRVHSTPEINYWYELFLYRTEDNA